MFVSKLWRFSSPGSLVTIPVNIGEERGGSWLTSTSPGIPVGRYKEEDQYQENISLRGKYFNKARIEM